MTDSHLVQAAKAPLGELHLDEKALRGIVQDFIDGAAHLLKVAKDRLQKDGDLSARDLVAYLEEYCRENTNEKDDN